MSRGPPGSPIRGPRPDSPERRPFSSVPGIGAIDAHGECIRPLRRGTESALPVEAGWSRRFHCLELPLASAYSEVRQFQAGGLGESASPEARVDVPPVVPGFSSPTSPPPSPAPETGAATTPPRPGPGSHVRERAARTVCGGCNTAATSTPAPSGRGRSAGLWKDRHRSCAGGPGQVVSTGTRSVNYSFSMSE